MNVFNSKFVKNLQDDSMPALKGSRLLESSSTSDKAARAKRLAQLRQLQCR